MLNIVIPKDNKKITVDYTAKEANLLYTYYIDNFYKFSSYPSTYIFRFVLLDEIKLNKEGKWEDFLQDDDKFNPFLKKFNDNIENLGIDIVKNGMYSPIIITEYENEFYLVEGRHKLKSLKEAKKNNKIPQNYKAFCLQVPYNFYEIINLNLDVNNEINYHIIEEFYMPTVLINEYSSRFKKFKEINSTISIIKITNVFELFFAQSLYFSFLNSILYNFNIAPVFKREQEIIKNFSYFYLYELENIIIDFQNFHINKLIDNIKLLLYIENKTIIKNIIILFDKNSNKQNIVSFLNLIKKNFSQIKIIIITNDIDIITNTDLISILSHKDLIFLNSSKYKNIKDWSNFLYLNWFKTKHIKNKLYIQYVNKNTELKLNIIYKNNNYKTLSDLFLSIYISYFQFNKYYLNCNSPQKNIFIDTLLNVNLCNFKNSFYLGNLYTNNILKLFELSNNNLKMFYKENYFNNNDKCKNCKIYNKILSDKNNNKLEIQYDYEQIVNNLLQILINYIPFKNIKTNKMVVYSEIGSPWKYKDYNPYLNNLNDIDLLQDIQKKGTYFPIMGSYSLNNQELKCRVKEGRHRVQSFLNHNITYSFPSLIVPEVWFSKPYSTNLESNLQQNYIAPNNYTFLYPKKYLIANLKSKIKLIDYNKKYYQITTNNICIIFELFLNLTGFLSNYLYYFPNILPLNFNDYNIFKEN